MSLHNLCLLFALLTFPFYASADASELPPSKFEQRFEDIREQKSSGGITTDEAIEQFKELMVKLPGRDYQLRARIASMLIQTYGQAGKMDAAAALYQPYRTVGLDMVPVNARLRMMTAMLNVHYRMYEDDQIPTLQQDILAIMHSQPDIPPASYAGVGLLLAFSYNLSGNYTAGIELLDQTRRFVQNSEAMPPEKKDVFLSAIERNNLNILAALGSVDSIRPYFMQAFSSAKEQDDHYASIDLHYQWGKTQLDNAHYQEAARHINKAVELAFSLDEERIAYDNMNLLPLAFYMGNSPTRALDTLTQYRAAHDDNPNMNSSTLLLVQLGAAAQLNQPLTPREALPVGEDGRFGVRQALDDENHYYLMANQKVQQKIGSDLSKLVADTAVYKWQTEMYQKKADSTSYQQLLSYDSSMTKATNEQLKDNLAYQEALLAEKQTQEMYTLYTVASAVILTIIVIWMVYRERAMKRFFHKVSRVDPLTKADNRLAIREYALEALHHARSNYPKGIGIALIDLDKFKSINDTYGHDAGDEVLRRFYEICAPLLREGDRLGRYGGEEFLLILPDAGEEDIKVVFNRLQQTLAESTFDVAGTPLPITVTISMGVSFYQPVNNEAPSPSLVDQLVTQADICVYQAKDRGRNQVVIA